MSEKTKPLAIENQGFDPGEVDAPSVALYGGLIIAVIVAVFLGVTLFWDKFLNGRYRDVVEGSPNAQIEDLHKREDAMLTGYRFVDKGKGQVRIPLDRAMQLLKDEMVMNMRLIGASNVDELTPDMVDCTGIYPMHKLLGSIYHQFSLNWFRKM